MYMEKLCQQGGNNILSSHPVYDVNTGISYLNMFCYLCNKSPDRPSFELGKPWDIEVYCEKFIEHRNFLLVKQLVKTINETHCNVTYLPRSFTPLCKTRNDGYKGTCNSTGNWLVKDPSGALDSIQSLIRADLIKIIFVHYAIQKLLMKMLLFLSASSALEMFLGSIFVTLLVVTFSRKSIFIPRTRIYFVNIAIINLASHVVVIFPFIASQKSFPP